MHFIYLHHVFRDEENEFRRMLSALTAGHYVVSYSEAVDRICQGTIDRPYLCFSFDDGLKNHLLAASILDEFGIKACFFVCPTMIGETDFNKLKRWSAERIHFPPVEILTWNDLEQLKTLGHEVGSHGLSHLDLSLLSHSESEAEVWKSREEIQLKLGECSHFAWPYGTLRNFTAAARKHVFQCGFRTCASAIRGCHVAGLQGVMPDLCIRREHLVALWPIRDVRYLLARSSRNATAATNSWPMLTGG